MTTPGYSIDNPAIDTEGLEPLLRAFRAAPRERPSLPESLPEPWNSCAAGVLWLLQTRLREIGALDRPEQLPDLLRQDEICRGIMRDLASVLHEAKIYAELQAVLTAGEG